MANYHTDQPVQSSDDDLFGRAKYAENIAKVIHSQPLNEKYVIGLYSPWGYGKSSILNMMEKELEDGDSLVVSFNPWIYTDIQSMTVGLLMEIARRINDVELGYDKDDKKLSRRDKTARWFKRKIRMMKTRGYRNSISQSVASIAEATSFSNSGISIGKSVASAAKLLEKGSFTTLKQNAEHDIEKLEKRVVVIIDDVDRLDKDEIFQLFKLVKAVADFKGITYVIAFDNIAVAQALNGRFSGGTGLRDGMDFLEKIIQIPLSLPYIPTDELRDMFVNGVNSLLEEYVLNVSDQDSSRFWQVFDKDILPSLKTPRQVKRFLNLLTFTLPLAGNEVNVTDVIVLTGLKILYPATYERIQRAKNLLTAQMDYEYFMDDDARKDSQKKKFEALAKDEEGAGGILTALFPVISKAYGSSGSWEDSDEKLRIDRRIASNEYFDRYFVFGVSNSDVSDSNIKETLTQKNPKIIAKKLKAMAKDPKAQKLIIIKIKQYKKEIVDSSSLLKGLIMASSSLTSSQEEGFFSRGGTDVFASLIFDIVQSISENKLQDTKDIITLCGDSELLTYVIRDFNLNFEDKNEESVLNAEEFQEFKVSAVNKIVELSAKMKFYDPPRKASYLLYQYWHDYSNGVAVKTHLEERLRTAKDVLDFLTSYLATWSGSNGRRRGDFNRPAYESVSKLIEPEKLYQTLLKNDKGLKDVASYPKLEHRDDDSDINKVGNEHTTEFRKILAEQFVYLYFQSISQNTERTET